MGDDVQMSPGKPMLIEKTNQVSHSRFILSLFTTESVTFLQACPFRVFPAPSLLISLMIPQFFSENSPIIKSYLMLVIFCCILSNSCHKLASIMIQAANKLVAAAHNNLLKKIPVITNWNLAQDWQLPVCFLLFVISNISKEKTGRSTTSPTINPNSSIVLDSKTHQ